MFEIKAETPQSSEPVNLLFFPDSAGSKPPNLHPSLNQPGGAETQLSPPTFTRRLAAGAGAHGK